MELEQVSHMVTRKTRAKIHYMTAKRHKSSIKIDDTKAKRRTTGAKIHYKTPKTSAKTCTRPQKDIIQ